jgi:hypothetical protein
MTRDQHKAEEMLHRSLAQDAINQAMELKRRASVLDQKAHQLLQMGLPNASRLEGLQLVREATTLRQAAEEHKRLASAHGKLSLYHSVQVEVMDAPGSTSPLAQGR